MLPFYAADTQWFIGHLKAHNRHFDTYFLFLSLMTEIKNGRGRLTEKE